MKIHAQHDRNGQLYWLAELRIKGRVLLCEGASYKKALHGAIELLIRSGEQTARSRFKQLCTSDQQAPAHQGLFLCPEKLHERYHQNPAL